MATHDRSAVVALPRPARLGLALAFGALVSALGASARGAEDVWYSERGIGSSGVTPASGLVTEFWDVPEGTDLGELAKNKNWQRQVPSKGLKPGSRRNIVWRVTLPHWGDNAPVVIREKVFLLYEDGWKAEAPMLLCLDVHTGETLWERPVDHLDALPAAEQKVAKAARATELARYRDYMGWWNKIYYNTKENRLKTKEEREADFPKLQKEADAAGWTFQNSGYAKGYKGPRSRFGLKFRDGKRGGVPKDAKRIANAKLVRKNRWLLWQHWTTEHPWYGNTHGSVVSDGESIYVVTGPGAAAAFDLEGKRKWVQWINPEWVFYRKSEGVHGCVQSPVLVDGALVYFHRDSATMFAFEKDTGKQRFATRVPPDPKGKKDAKFHNFSGHIGPGSTSIVLRLGDEAVAVAGNGMVVRVRDGRMLGLVDGKIHSYFDMAGAGDIYVTTFLPSGKGPRHIGAVRLGIDGDKLTQERLWTSTAEVGNWEGGGNVTVDGGRVLVKFKGKTVGGMCALNLQTGKVLKTKGPSSEYYAVGAEHYVVKTSNRKNTRYRSAAVVDKRTFAVVGRGLLVEPPAAGEIAERHIAFLGWPEIWTGYSKVSAWGNRIFIRTNDYLWCIGDPEVRFSGGVARRKGGSTEGVASSRPAVSSAPEPREPKPSASRPAPEPAARSLDRGAVLKALVTAVRAGERPRFYMDTMRTRMTVVAARPDGGLRLSSRGMTVSYDFARLSAESARALAEALDL